IPLLAGVLIPEALHSLRPTTHLLDLVQHEDRRSAGGFEPRCLPLLRDPVRSAERGLVRARVTHGHIQAADCLLDGGGFADLARPRHNLNEPPRLAEAGFQYGNASTPE